MLAKGWPGYAGIGRLEDHWPCRGSTGGLGGGCGCRKCHPIFWRGTMHIESVVSQRRTTVAHLVRPRVGSCVCAARTSPLLTKIELTHSITSIHSSRSQGRMSFSAPTGPMISTEGRSAYCLKPTAAGQQKQASTGVRVTSARQTGAMLPLFGHNADGGRGSSVQAPGGR